MTQSCTFTWAISWVSIPHIRINDILNVDISDHILSLQQALAHYEWMMAKSHPIYLTQLDIQAVKAKANLGKAAIILTVVSVGVVVELTPIGKHQSNAKRFLC